MSLTIKWNKRAINAFTKAIKYIEEDSELNAEKVKNEILAAIAVLATYPEKYPPDKYKVNNDKSFKAFEIYHFRISYRFEIMKSVL